MLKRLRNLCFDERGMSFVFVGIGLMTFMAATTLAVDVGMFMTARTQAQTSADAGALAGATALVFNSWADRTAPEPPSRGRTTAPSRTTAALSSRWAAGATCWKSQPPQPPGPA